MLSIILSCISSIGTIYGFWYVFVYFQYGVDRHLAIAGIAITTGILLYPFHLPFFEGLISFLMVMALTIIVAGVIAFLNLIRTPIAVEADAE